MRDGTEWERRDLIGGGRGTALPRSLTIPSLCMHDP